jgi:hypothetical protein
MKKVFYTSCLILLLILTSVITVLSSIGYETDKFNKIILKKINENNKKISLRLKKIKFKFDIQKISLFFVYQI